MKDIVRGQWSVVRCKGHGAWGNGQQAALRQAQDRLAAGSHYVGGWRSATLEVGGKGRLRISNCETRNDRPTV
jgi:hypothetical protein